MKTKLVPFDIEKAKQGARIVTDDERRRPVRVLEYNRKVKSDYTHAGDDPIVALVDMGDYEDACYFTNNGEGLRYNLCIEEEVEAKCMESQNGGIVLEDFNSGEGFYKVQLDYLNKEQVEEIKQTVRAWNKELKPTNDSIKACIGMCLTDASEQRFKNYNTNLRDCLAWLEKQGEKNTADSLEIKPDRWYTCIETCHSIDVIDFAEDHYYLGSDILKYGLLEKNKDYVDYFHPWTIQDAKPGDVLVCIGGKYGQEIGIVKKYVGKYGGCDKCFETYCFVDWEGIFRLGEYMGSKEIYPATKEQRDFLFQKMKEAGYEWNPDTKELKKIDADTAEKKIKTRKMTYKELSWWLREHPEEHREYTHEDIRKSSSNVYSCYDYNTSYADEEVNEYIRIRKNGGEWEEPFIEN